MENKNHVKNPLHLEDLYAAFEAADNIILKKYLANLSECPCIKLPDELKKLEIGSNVSLYRVAQIVYDKNENIQDKLTTVYSSVFSLKNCGLVMLINGQKDRVDLFLGVVTRRLTASFEGDTFSKFTTYDKEIIANGRVLKNAFAGNFPGTKMPIVQKVTTKKKKMKEFEKELHKNDGTVVQKNTIEAYMRDWL